MANRLEHNLLNFSQNETLYTVVFAIRLSVYSLTADMTSAVKLSERLLSKGQFTITKT